MGGDPPSAPLRCFNGQEREKNWVLVLPNDSCPNDRPTDDVKTLCADQVRALRDMSVTGMRTICCQKEEHAELAVCKKLKEEAPTSGDPPPVFCKTGDDDEMVCYKGIRSEKADLESMCEMARVAT